MESGNSTRAKKPPRRRLARRGLAPALLVSSSLMLSGCSTIVAGTITLGDVSNVAGLLSTLTTGKGLEEHLVSYIMGKDCRFSEGLLREDRKICEEPGALATDKDFKGVIVMLFPEDTPRRRYARDVEFDSLATLTDESTPRPSMTQHAERRRPGNLPADDPFANDTLTLAGTGTLDDVPLVKLAMSRTERRGPAPVDSDPITTDTDNILMVDADVRASVLADLRPSLMRTHRRPAVIAEPDTMTVLAQDAQPIDREQETRVVHVGELPMAHWSAAMRPARRPEATVNYAQDSTQVRIAFD